jgi:hypothetical protein
MDDLNTLMRQAVEDVEPTHRTRELWDGVAVATRRRHRNRLVGGLLATAVLLGGAAVAVNQSGEDPELQPAGPTTARDDEEARPAYGVYYLGSTPQGTRLFREFRDGPGPSRTPAGAISLLQSSATDPDYWTLWDADTFADAREVGDHIEVEVAHPSQVQDRPDGMTAADANLSVQQVVYTVTGAVQDPIPVQFTHEGAPVDQVFGVPTGEPIERAPQLDVLARVSISNPTDRRVVEDAFSVDGAASSFEGNVPWELRDSDGNVVEQGSAQTYGWMDRLYPFATGRIDVSGLEPGEYTLVVTEEDPSGGTEGPGPTVDTRTVIIK